MRPLHLSSALGLALLLSTAGWAGTPAGSTPAPSISTLLSQARARQNARPRVELAPESAEVFQGIETLEAPNSGRVPNYVRAMASVPASVKPMAKLVRTVLVRGAVQPEIKLAMGLKIAQLDGSPYVAAHLSRLLKTSETGRRLAKAVAGDKVELATAEAAALSFAAALGTGPRALGDDEFRKVRAWYNDSQAVELTVAVSFFSFFNRYCEGLNLPVEAWVLETPAPALPAWEPRPERVSLASNAEIEQFRLTAERMSASPKPEPGKSAARSGGLGIGIANSQRAMVRAPEQMEAWFGFWSAARESQVVERNDKLQVSFAVSMVNGCRYCTVHQVVGLRRLGVDPAKLLAMKKGDSTLTPRERAAVLFARKLTRKPGSVTDADYRALEAEFTRQGALEVLLQTACFNFMNRFTDGLKLPSEDEAIHIYQEVYGDGSYAGYGKADAARAR